MNKIDQLAKEKFNGDIYETLKDLKIELRENNLLEENKNFKKLSFW